MLFRSWNNSEFKNTSVGRTATQIEKNLKVEANLGRLEKNSPAEHRISLKFLAAQTLAKLEYRGWIQAALNYNARSAVTEAEVLENISNNKDLVVSHSISGKERKSKLSLRWNW